MLPRELALPLSLLLVLAAQLPAAVGLADSESVPSAVEGTGEALSQPKAGKGLDPNAKPKEQPTAPGQPISAVVCKCGQAKPPLYVEDWGRLAALTQSDPVVFEKAEFWRNRQDTSRWLLVTGVFLGGGAAALGTLDRLSKEAWSNTSKWSVAGGLGVAAVSLMLHFAFSPDRDDRLTVINHWNIRHPDLLLAP